MKSLNVLIIGYISYIVSNSAIFIADILAGQGGSGKMFEKFWLWFIGIASILIFTGTAGYFFRIFPKTKKFILIIFSSLFTIMQVAGLFFIFFFFAMHILAPLFLQAGFYVTMP